MKRISTPISEELLEEFQVRVPRGFRSEVIRNLIGAANDLLEDKGPNYVMAMLTGKIKIDIEMEKPVEN